MADEASFISLIVAQARVDQLMKYALDSAYPGRQMQSMRELTELVQREEVVQEAARDSHMARSLTTLLASTSDSTMLDAISALLAALSGSGVHTPRLMDYTYSGTAGIDEVVLTVSECGLKEGVGSRLWGISHTFNLFVLDSLAQFISGAYVLELGSGVGSTGVVAAKLGAREVTLSDLTEPLLRNLLSTVRLNFTSDDSASNSASQSAAACAVAGETCGDIAFSDAESVSDEAELFGDEDLRDQPLDENKPHFRNESALRGAQQRTSSYQQWDVSTVRVRELDWKLEWDRYVELHGEPMPPHKANPTCTNAGVVQPEEDETTSALDSLQIDGISPASAAASLTQGSAGVSKSRKEGDRDTFDLPSAPSDAMPPAVDPSSTFHVVLGCEVLYETPHAQWVAAAIKLRMKHGGRAWIAGAVRDSKVYDAFDSYLAAVGLQYEWQCIHPAPGYSGLGNKEATYEGGYRLYTITHAQDSVQAAAEG